MHDFIGSLPLIICARQLTLDITHPVCPTYIYLLPGSAQCSSLTLSLASDVRCAFVCLYICGTPGSETSSQLDSISLVFLSTSLFNLCLLCPVMDTSAADASHVNDNVGATKVSGGPIPMSFPAILRNPALSSRFAHLQEPKERSKLSSAVARNKSGTQKEGRRWVRRLDNARFAANPHITLPTARDHVLPLPHKRMTFPEPLPSYLPRTCSAPTPTLPPSNPASTYAGHFSHSLKGVRRNLRKSNKARGLVKVVESELLAWLDDASVLVNPQLQGSSGAGKALDSQGIVREISRTVGQMIWAISDDGFARYIVHCVARWYGVVSFSK